MSEQPTANQIVRQIADRIALKACGTAWRDTESQARAAASYAAHEIFDLERELAEARAVAQAVPVLAIAKSRAEAERDALRAALREMVAVYSGQIQNDGGYGVLENLARPALRRCAGNGTAERSEHK